jgi:hypothetical protein
MIVDRYTCLNFVLAEAAIISIKYGLHVAFVVFITDRSDNGAEADNNDLCQPCDMENCLSLRQQGWFLSASGYLGLVTHVDIQYCLHLFVPLLSWMISTGDCKQG